jgi:hypothetical protein
MLAKVSSFARLALITRGTCLRLADSGMRSIESGVGRVAQVVVRVDAAEPRGLEHAEEERGDSGPRCDREPWWSLRLTTVPRARTRKHAPSERPAVERVGEAA